MPPASSQAGQCECARETVSNRVTVSNRMTGHTHLSALGGCVCAVQGLSILASNSALHVLRNNSSICLRMQLAKGRVLGTNGDDDSATAAYPERQCLKDQW
jgi:hypothetical protein